MKNRPTQDWKDIEDGEVTLALNKTSNWKSAGIDRVPNFWLKNLERLHGSLTTAYNDIVRNPEKSPEWLTQGLTYLLPKKQWNKEPEEPQADNSQSSNIRHNRENIHFSWKEQPITTRAERMREEAMAAKINYW